MSGPVLGGAAQAGPQEGQQPTPVQIEAMRQQIIADAAKHGMSPEQYLAQLRTHAMRQSQQQQQSQAGAQSQQPHSHDGHEHSHDHPHQQQQEQQIPITPGEPTPQALALQKWLRSQDLKSRPCILKDQRKDMFKVKRALRAIQSPAYAAASAKNPELLPPVKDRPSAEEVFKLLPLSLLALRVSKIDPHEGHDHAKAKKRTKGLWTVKVEQQQEVKDELHFIWLQDGPQWRTKLYAVGALALIMTVVLFPLWPIKLRIGVWYLSMGMLGLIGLFFAMAIFRLILFGVTIFAVPPGLWLYPNLFEDVGFFDSFRPLWGWQEEAKKGKKRTKKTTSSKNTSAASGTAHNIVTPAPLTGASTDSANVQRRQVVPRVVEVEDE